MNDILRRIEFYTRKAVAYKENPLYPLRRNRRARLIAYRDAVMRRVEAAGWRWRPVIEV